MKNAVSASEERTPGHALMSKGAEGATAGRIIKLSKGAGAPREGAG